MFDLTPPVARARPRCRPRGAPLPLLRRRPLPPGPSRWRRSACRAWHTRHHRADGNAQRLGHFGITELFHAHQHQRLALFGRQACQRRQQVQAQADIGAVAAAFGVERALDVGRVGELHARIAAAAVEEGVVRDRQQPHQHVALGVELAPVRERPLQRLLRQVVGFAGFVRERSRIAAQARDGVEQPLAEDRWSVHGAVYVAGRRLFPARA
ncbi:MAG: hypothetical protein U1F25_15080 [Rubrivivax sp.]